MARNPMARNGHKSSIAALVMSGAKPAWVRPHVDRLAAALEQLAGEHRIPVLVPGEVITEEIAEHLEHVVGLGGFVEGATDQALDRFRVVAGA
jgi:arginine/lysine/ornithine decarboxylase